jgi:type VI secretion system VasD/TssJ family lipoprotein
MSQTMLRNLLLTCALVAAHGCGAELPKTCDHTEKIALRLRPAKRLNPDRAGLPRSVVLRLYQLDDARGFHSRSFEQLWNAPDNAQPDQLIAIPGQSRTHAVRRDPKANFLAIAANFRERRGDRQWRALVRLPAPHDPCTELPTERSRPVEVVLADYALSLR